MIRPDPSDPDAAALVSVKVVPGARRGSIVGRLGDRLKVRVPPPPEQGKANAAALALLAKALGVSPAALEIASGHTSAEKTVRVRGLPAIEAAARLGLGLEPSHDR